MSRVVVVGSGASAVHFALSALDKGHHVTMLDVGNERPAPRAPGLSITDLKDGLDDPMAYFLGEDYRGVMFPGDHSTFYEFPATKDYVFSQPSGFRFDATEMEPRFTFARGGFAETWTAGVYSFVDDDLVEFPISYADLRPGYTEVSRRIGISAQRDDLERFLPFYDEFLPPLDMDLHSTQLLDAYASQRGRLNRMGWYMGRSRVATLSREHRGRGACTRLGRCMLGCPTESIYTPVVTLRECLSNPRFRYVPGMYVTHFEYDSDDRVRAFVAERPDGEEGRFEGDVFALGAGALSSSKIFLDSLFRATGRIERLTGLMDNRQIHVPFLTLAMMGKPVDIDAYQYHHLAFGISTAEPLGYVHGQITTLKGAALHPILQNLPVDMATGIEVFRALRSGLGVANVNLRDTRREQSYVTIQPLTGSSATSLVVRYADDPREPVWVKSAVGAVKRALRRLGALVPPGLTRVLPKGHSVHYAGTLPMSYEKRPRACSPDGRSYDFPNLLLIDGVSFPALPAKNHTFTLMANAVRIAEATL